MKTDFDFMISRRRAAAGGAAAVAAGLLWIGATAVDCPAQEAEKPKAADSGAAMPKPVVGTHELMHLLNEPLYKYLKEAMEGELDSDEAWTTVSDRGIQVAEIANLVALRKDDEAWRELTAKLQQAGVGLSEAAKSQDPDATRAAYRTVVNRCNACHQEMATDHAPKLEP